VRIALSKPLQHKGQALTEIELKLEEMQGRDLIEIETQMNALVTDFSKADGDVLDLRDLLVGESHLGLDTGNLSSYLHFEVSNGNTVVHVSTTGGFANGVYDAAKEDQTIVLTGVNLLNDGSATLLNDNAVIQDLLKSNRLITD